SRCGAALWTYRSMESPLSGLQCRLQRRKRQQACKSARVKSRWRPNELTSAWSARMPETAGHWQAQGWDDLEGAALLAAPKPRRRRVGAQYLGPPFDFAQGKLRVCSNFGGE